MPNAIDDARAIIADRVRQHPGSPFYAMASNEMSRIDARLALGSKPDRAFYETLTRGIGLMCARELEASDMAFCDAIYRMMGEIRRVAEDR